jgi:cysteine synthase A
MEAIKSMTGYTPLIKIDYRYKGKPGTIFAKAEYYNLTGSIKDRIAYHILAKACREGRIKPGDIIAEATSGNTGIAFAAMGAILGHKVVIYMPDWMSRERMALISNYGAEIRLVSREEGGFLGSIAKANALAESDPNVFLPLQFDNEDNCEAHETTTAVEIWAQLASRGRRPDISVAGVGTGGTIMGLRNFFKPRHATAKTHPLEPANSPTLTTGHQVGKHRIQGISDEFIPSIVKLDRLDDIVMVDDGDAIIMAQQLSRKLGLGVGISSGGNFIGAVMRQAAEPDATVVTIFADDNKKYLSTDYIREETVKEGFLSPHIELLSAESILCDEAMCRPCLT